MRAYQTKQNAGALPDSITVGKWGAGEFNAMAVELETAVSSSDQTLAPADGTGEVPDQLAMALAVYGAGGAEYCLDTGAVNAYVLTQVSPKKAAPAYFDGMTLSFIPGNINNSASTINYAGLGVKSVRDISDAALTGGELYLNARVRYSTVTGRFHVLSAEFTAIDIAVKTSSGTYAKPSGLKFIEVTVIGGGGGGGGAGTTNEAASTGGGGGGAAVKVIPAGDLSASETVTIGAGGAGGTSGGDGSAGGTTSLGSHCSSTGGSGGNGSVIVEAVTGRAGGIGSGGDINIEGGGSPGIAGLTSGGESVSSPGGSSILGGATISGVNGHAGSQYGGGGSGARRVAGVGKVGGAGADGVILIREFF